MGKWLRSCMSFLFVVLMLSANLCAVRAEAAESHAGCEHSYANGFCRFCDAYEPADRNGDTYEIANAGQLYWFAEVVNNGNYNANAVLTADIVINSNVLVDGKLNPDASAVANFHAWKPIGYDHNSSMYVYYTGTFNGQGHTVSGLYYSGADNFMGLFGYTDTGAMIQNVGIIGSWISAGEGVGYASLGAVIGRADDTTISGCWSDSVIIGNGNAVGGIVGETQNSQISDCYNTGSITGVSQVGGIVGISTGTVTNCYNSGSVTGSESGSDIGGVVGNANHYSDSPASDDYYTYITKCYNAGAVKNGDNVGGILGSGNFCVLNDCYNTGAVSGSSKFSYAAGAGGIVGDANRSCSVNDCYNTGSVSANYKSVGGVMGSNIQSTLSNCYYLAGCATDGNGVSQKGLGSTVLGSVGSDNGTTAKTVAQFASGEIAWLLNHSTDQGDLVWMQIIGTDASPNFEGYVVHHDANAESPYYNDAVQTHKHTFDRKETSEDYLASEATCDEAASYYFSCTCGEKGTETFVYGESLGHDDADKDHNCDTCGAKLSDCADADDDHNCDTCGEKLSDCGDTKPADHKCDICGKVLSTCGDKNQDGKCDVCGAITVPAKPYNIVNVVSGVHVYWKTVPGAAKYGLWRSETGKNGTYKWIANPTVPHFTDTKVESGKTYYYKVTTMVGTSHSEKSDAIGVIYVGTPDITSRVNKAAGITVGWNKIKGAQGYAIYRKSYSGTDAWVRVATISGNSTFTWQDTSVKNANGTAYKYTVRALAGSDLKTLSGCRNAGRSMVRLTSRVLNSAVKASATSIKCSWTTSSVVTGYEVRFMVGSTVYKTFTVGNYKTGVKTFTGLETGKTYKIQVRSYVKIDGMGFYSAWSEAKNVTLP